MNEDPVRIIVVTERTLARSGLYDALQRGFDIRTVYIDDSWPSDLSTIPDYREAKAVLWFVHYRLLVAELEGLNWADFTGHRILYDQDASHAVMSVGFQPVNNQWIPAFHRHKFDILLCSGKALTNTLNGLGVPALWLPKAYDPRYFRNLGLERRGYCYFGSPYVSRQAMLHRLNREGIAVEHFATDFTELNSVLNLYSALLVCTLSNWTRGRTSRFLRKLNPEWGLKLSTGPEPMLKLFEGAAAGCAVFNDYLDELSDLGFIDGETVVTWADFDELVEKARYYLAHESRLVEIGRHAGELCVQRHTWHHRVEDLKRRLITQDRGRYQVDG